MQPDRSSAATTKRRRWRRWLPLLLVATLTLGMSLSISEGHALGAALQGLLVGLYFWDAIDSLPRRHRGS